ncbi:hypothetical protein HZH66_005014 [Vespula vulgaris]|uniref:Uncharacterized protein n=1 Tax=Vespula vulgaris TaxID=7454 RepID=A0A834KBA3_VESVU|nr:hypothetical protein HZH66_005014 [Vespula vulgaris]
MAAQDDDACCRQQRWPPTTPLPYTVQRETADATRRLGDPWNAGNFEGKISTCNVDSSKSLVDWLLDGDTNQSVSESLSGPAGARITSLVIEDMAATWRRVYQRAFLFNKNKLAFGRRCEEGDVGGSTEEYGSEKRYTRERFFPPVVPPELNFCRSVPSSSRRERTNGPPRLFL